MLKSKCNRWVLLLVKAVAAAVIVVVICVAALVVSIDVNDYKKQITDLIKEKTGQQVRINGKIKLALFPWVGIKVSGIEIAGAAGFEQQALLTIKRADFHARLMPLFNKRLQTIAITLNGLKLNLVRDRSGQENWVNLTRLLQRLSPAKQDNAIVGPGVALSIKKISITDSRLEYRDFKNSKRIYVQNLNLTSGEVGNRWINDVNIELDYIDHANKSLQPVFIKYEGGIVYQPEQSTIQFKAFKLALGNIKLEGDIRLSALHTHPHLAGHLSSNRFKLHKTLALLGMTSTSLLTLPGPGRAKFDFNFNYDSTQLRLSQIKASVDELQASGDVRFQFDGLSPRFFYDIKLDKLNLDRYPIYATKLPVKQIRRFNGRGRLRIDDLHAFGLRSTEVNIPLLVNNGIINITGATAKLKAGTYRGDLTIDVRKTVPRVRLKESIRGLSGTTLYRWLSSTAIFPQAISRLSGRATLKVDLNSQGNTYREIMRHLQGHIDFSIVDGQVRGVNLVHAACRTLALSQKRIVRPAESDSTQFSVIAAKFNVKRGVFRNNDFYLASSGRVIRVRGKGWADLWRDRIKYRLQAKLDQSRCQSHVAGAAKRKPTLLKYWVTGRLSKPQVKVVIKSKRRRHTRKTRKIKIVRHGGKMRAQK